MINRRSFLKLGSAAAMGLFIPLRIDGRTKTYGFFPTTAPHVTLDPGSIPKYVTQLIVPPAMPRVSEITLPDGSAADYYEITLKQFSQDILPASMLLSPTTVWSYVKADIPSTYNYPGFTIEAQADRPIQVKWINGLVTAGGNYLPHLLPVDQTLHWANPPGPRDMETHNPTFYTGPVPMVTHVHGAHTRQESDGYPEAWYLPAAADIPPGYFDVGTFYTPFKENFANTWGVTWDPGTATFHYPNDQRASTTWFHDHSLGITRLNVYAGPAAFYLLRGGPHDLPAGTLPGPAPGEGDDPFGVHYEIPLAIQDRTFNTDGSLFYPDNRAYFEGVDPTKLQIPLNPAPACDGQMSDIAPIWNPEFFGDTIVVNGRTWPTLSVEKRRYRFRLLNGCNSRFLIVRLTASEPAVRPVTDPLPMWVIGNEGGFLPAPVQLDELVLAPAERFDVIVDFSSFAEGTKLYLINEGPDEPYGGGVPGVDFTVANPNTTGQIMQFEVGPIVGSDISVDPAALTLPEITHLGPASSTRPLALVEEDSHTVRSVVDDQGNIVLACNDPEAEAFGPAEAVLGIVPAAGPAVPLSWDDEITETPVLNEVEIWELYNFTMDAHPIHIHQITFEVVNRQAIEIEEDGVPTPVGSPRPPELWEGGFKDTVIAFPGEVTRIKAKFDIPGLFVWHCHILEHEDNEMMRPFRVVRQIYMPFVSMSPSAPPGGGE